ncbi:hypothetical protein E2P64_06445 [Candidatus Bathyarchaeota archaeon]|nr:hypothetical protein E2P64_06445 [Candidatus Bathyarchaeota archaeon]
MLIGKESQLEIDRSELVADVKVIVDGLVARILAKNRYYGNSVLSPVRIFSKADDIEQINVRIDDKLSRIGNGAADDDEDPIDDLLGYLVLLKVARKRQREKGTAQVGTIGLVTKGPVTVNPNATLRPTESKE